MKRILVSEDYLLNLLEDKLKAEGYPECKFLKLPPMPGGASEDECNWSIPHFTCGENVSSTAFSHVKQAISAAQAMYNVDYSARRRSIR